MSEKKFSLYELNGLYLNILNNAAEWDDEAWQIAFDSIGDSIEVKVENYAKMIRHLEGEQQMLKAEEERIAKRRKSLESQVKRLKDNMMLSMELTEKPKIKSSLFTIYIQERTAQSVDVTNEKQLLKEYKIPSITIDKKQLLADLKAGKVVRGARLQESHSKSVQIR